MHLPIRWTKVSDTGQNASLYMSTLGACLGTKSPPPCARADLLVKSAFVLEDARPVELASPNECAMPRVPCRHRIGQQDAQTLAYRLNVSEGGDARVGTLDEGDIAWDVGADHRAA